MQHRPAFFVGLMALGLATLPGRAWAQVGSRIDCPPREELRALRPLADHGAAALVYYPDAGPGARISVVVPVAAQESEFGPAAARWDMVEESATRTLLVITDRKSVV